VTTPDFRSEVPRSGAQNYARDLTSKVGSGDGRLFTLTELQRHAAELAQNPAEWMPWNYRATLEATVAKVA
jgi:hypothetical protein